jgi:hypothetical protein
MRHLYLLLLCVFFSEFLFGQGTSPMPVGTVVEKNSAEALSKNIQKFVLYDIPNDLTFSKVSFDNIIEDPGKIGRCYKMNFAIYNSKGFRIADFHGVDVSEAPISQFGQTTTMDFLKPITLKSGQYYFAYNEQDEPDCKSKAVLKVFCYRCKDYDVSDQPKYFYRKINGKDDASFPNLIPPSIFHNLYDDTHTYKRAVDFEAFKLKLL